MLKNLRGFFDKYPCALFARLVLGYLLLTLPALLSTNHILYNLEPYPDGLLYALSARNAAEGRGLQLVNEDSVIPIWVPPLYAYSLVPGYALSSSPNIYYVINVLFGVLALVLLMYLAKKMFKSPLAGIIAGGVYLAHALVTWVASVPMTENLSPLLLLMALTGLLLPRRKIWLTVSLAGILGLFLTRYSVILTVLILAALLVARYAWGKNRQLYTVSAIVGLLAASAAALILSTLSSLNIFTVARSFVSALMNGTQYFNLAFIPNNFVQYSKSLLGFPTQFLWQNKAFSSAAITLPTLGYLLLQLNQRGLKQKWQSLVILLVFLSQYPILLVFYTVDTRYSILGLPLLALGAAGLFSYLKNKHTLKIAGVVLALMLGILGVTQLPLYREILANNILHRSQAWQYESIQHFNSFFETNNNPEAILITALPPHLVEAYQNTPYRLLPLSEKQEFMQKKLDAWGSDVFYEDLTQEYVLRLERGEQIYISNAYITHQHEVVEDFERLGREFNLKQVSEGCDGACNLYLLQPLPVQN